MTSFDRVLFGLHHRAPFVNASATVGQMPPPPGGDVPPPMMPFPPAPPPAPAPRSSWPLLFAGAALAGAIVYIYRSREHDQAELERLEREIEPTAPPTHAQCGCHHA